MRKLLLFLIAFLSLIVGPLAPSALAQERNLGAVLGGAEPWTESDCTGAAPIVVASDAAAQSDIYSSITLAGVIGTDCVVLAGSRDGDMSVGQRERLDVAADGGYVLGGFAAVADAKIGDREMKRLGGTSRWETARLVGSEARTLAGGTPLAGGTATASSTTPHPSSAISADIWHTCGIRTDKSVTCWGFDGDGQSDAPSGSFSKVSVGFGHSCGLRSDGTVSCWGSSLYYRTEAPQGSFVDVSSGYLHSCGVRADGTVRCWGGSLATGQEPIGRPNLGQIDAPSGTFSAVSAGFQHSCGLRTDNTVICWGADGPDWRTGADADVGQTRAPSGTFSAVSAGFQHSCGIRTDGTVTCWGAEANGVTDAPSGTFSAVSASYDASCGIRTDGTVTCWGNVGLGIADAPSGYFTAVSVGQFHACGIRAEGTATCWGADGYVSVGPPTYNDGDGHLNVGQATAPSGAFGAVATPVRIPGVFLHGAAPWIASDCTGDVPIVVGSDAKAQSDIYSAITLAGVLGTDCVVLAGPRDGAMAANQRARLDTAAPGGYVLGGHAAVPAAKVTGRSLTRLGGADRWATSQLVGTEARMVAAG